MSKLKAALYAIVGVQKKGGIAAFIDAEHMFNVISAQDFGIDIEKLLISQPDTRELAIEIAETLIRSGAVDLVVLGLQTSFPYGDFREGGCENKTLMTIAHRTETILMFV
jgi:RecA/RadA recombinase